ncbi:MAG: lysylphosphatidylglycerol synthase transmembrane domain-containing protein [Ignavibacteriales bacterium]|nr:lysylphosphatidylglycerol synthase transmembrane domain-containing protein [Ignavibacteriales bacterium]
MEKKKYIKWFQIFGIILFIIILTRLDFGRIENQLIHFKWVWLSVYALSLILMLLFKVLRWGTALSRQGINYSISKVFAINAITSFWGIVTPGRLGEFGKVLFLQKDNYSFAKSSVSIIIDRLYDITILLFLGIFSLVYFFSLLDPNIGIFVTIFILIIGCLILIYFLKKDLRDLLKKAVKFFLSKEKYNKLAKEWNIFKSDFGTVFSSTIVPMFLYSILAYLCYYVQIYVVALGFGVNISFIYLGLCSSLAALISLIPISIGGLGTREVVFLFLLSKVSISSETAVLISFIDGGVFAVIITGLLALISHFLLELKYR